MAEKKYTEESEANIGDWASLQIEKAHLRGYELARQTGVDYAPNMNPFTTLNGALHQAFHEGYLEGLTHRRDTHEEGEN